MKRPTTADINSQTMDRDTFETAYYGRRRSAKTLQQHYRKQKMYKKFADLSRRMDGASADIAAAQKEYDALLEKQDVWTVKFKDDLKIGVHLIPGGNVVVSELSGTDKLITFHAIDKDTQTFAVKYSVYARALQGIGDDIKELQTRQCKMVRARRKHFNKFRDILVDGAYDVAGGTVSVANGEVTFDV